ncbi:MAG TPA: efflux RND transporter permease subunit, partial [bacterium]|nr:efflux RND transporter permease subunit [bacterium]
MEKFIGFFAKKSLLVNLLAVFVTIAGIFTFIISPKEALPEIKLGFAVITTVYPGAGPEEVEKLVTIPIEDAIDSIKGIKETVSSSSEGISIITVSFDEGADNTNTIINDIENAIGRVEIFPREVDKPRVREFTTDEFPVIQVSVSGGNRYGETRDAAEILERRISEIYGVSSVSRFGFLDRVIWVEMDREKQAEFGATIYSLVNALRGRSFSMPAGNMEIEGSEHSVRVLAELKTAEDVGRVIVRSNEAGRFITAGDIADVNEGFARENYYVRADGEKAILLTVLKASGADSISIIKEIRETAQAVKKELSDTVKIKFSNDTSIFIKDRLDVVFQNGGAGALLVLAVLLLMLRPSVAFLTALGLPVAFGLSLLVIKMLGISYDMLSLFGYVMVLGMIVDNAIVVGENVYRHLEEGKLPERAAVEGSAEMIVPVTASVATTIAAFFPLLMVGGVLGGFLAPIP